MNSIQRIRGIRKAVMKFILRKPVQKFVTAGDRDCWRMMRKAHARQRCDRGYSIPAWAKYDLTWEMISGIWDVRTAAKA